MHASSSPFVSRELGIEILSHTSPDHPETYLQYIFLSFELFRTSGKHSGSESRWLLELKFFYILMYLNGDAKLLNYYLNRSIKYILTCQSCV